MRTRDAVQSREPATGPGVEGGQAAHPPPSPPPAVTTERQVSGSALMEPAATPRRRRPNAKPGRDAPGVTLAFLPHLFAILKRNTTAGGYQDFENWLLDNTDPVTLQCVLDPVRLERLMRYCRSYGAGGPNKRIRAACIPALRQAGIELLPGLSA